MSSQWNSTILTPDEIEALSTKPVGRLSKDIGASTSLVYNALKGKKISGDMADRLRDAANGNGSVAANPRRPRSGGKGGRPGDSTLAPAERRALRGLLKTEAQRDFCKRIGLSDHALSRAREGLSVREETAAKIRAGLAGEEVSAPPPFAPPRRTGMPLKRSAPLDPVGPLPDLFGGVRGKYAERYAERLADIPAAPSRLRDVASFVEGQIIMAEFLSMSILNFVNGTDARGES